MAKKKKNKNTSTDFISKRQQKAQSKGQQKAQEDQINSLCSSAQLCKDLYTHCPFMPDMTCREGDYEYNEELYANVRKEPKQFKCMYDNKDLNWERKCPREINKILMKIDEFQNSQQ